MKNLSEQIIEADKLVRDLRKIHIWIENGKIVAAWKEAARLIALYESRKIETIKKSTKDSE